MRGRDNLHRHELIGLEVEVISKSGLSGLTGKIVDETRNMFLVETKEGGTKESEKKVPKKGNQFRFPGYDTILDGEKILARPEDRIKK